jgi:hypothetical protein
MALTNESDLISFQASQVLRPYALSDRSRDLKVLFSAWRWREHLDFNFILHGSTPEALNSVVLPDVVTPETRERRDELWKTTCLEFFLAGTNQKNYFEMNLSPSGDWNLYAFDDYRSGMRPATSAEVSLMKVERAVRGDTIIWQGSLRPTTSGDGTLASLLTPASNGARSGLVMGVACVMEYKTGDKDYWALAHAGEKPDFHLRESFRLAL